MNRPRYAFLAVAIAAVGLLGAFALQADDEEIEAQGPIEAVDVASGMLTVDGLTFLANETTLFGDEEDGDAPFTLADLAVGDPVEVDGYRDADDTLIALEVEQGYDDEDGDDGEDDS
ncbi:MAG: hypothetical protein HKN04_14685 [Rhodothermaceae bacterium]|nr:hypothetical protein [Rhodothermaceae bacterium]